MSAFDSYVQAAFYGNVMVGGPTFTVVHDAETPLRAGYADSIAEFFRVGPKAGTSAHAMVDPVKAIKLLPDNVVAWAAGPYANPFGWHLEQAGYARFTRADWTTRDGMAQLHRVGGCLREVHDTWGIPKRWMTDDQLRRAAKGDRASGGMTTHQQVARVLRGTTHTDPEDNYPRDLLLPVVLGTTTTTTVHTEEDDDMKTPYKAYRSDPAQKGPDGTPGNGTIALSAPGTWFNPPSPAHFELLKGWGWCEDYQNVPPNLFEFFRGVALSSESNDEQIQAALAQLSEDEARRFATAAHPAS